MMERHLFPNVEDYDVEDRCIGSLHESFYWSGWNAANVLLRSLNEEVEELAEVGYYQLMFEWRSALGGEYRMNNWVNLQLKLDRALEERDVAMRARDHVWWWSDTDHNDLASMSDSLVVTMTAAQLRALLASPERVRKALPIQGDDNG